MEHLGFPSWREIQRWRGSFLDENGINSELLNGEISNLRRIFSTYFGTGYETVNPRVVLAVDAAGISPRVVVHKNGDVDGFLNSNARVSPEDATRLRDSLKDLQRFVQDHQSDIVRDFFVVFACPLESDRGGFPVFLYPKQNGSADGSFVLRLGQVIANVRACSVDMVGLACDGDPGYLKFVREITDSFECIDPMKALHEHDYTGLLVFEDLLHLAKCVRYRFICRSKLCPYPHASEVVCVQDFEESGIVPWVLDSSQVRKMDDFLPLMMFTGENIFHALDIGKPSVFLCLLPVTLLISAVMETELTRKQRMNYLSQAWAMFWCYKQAYTKSLPHISKQKERKMKGSNEAMAIYDKNTCDKALSLCYALSKVIADSRPVHLGALGTHWLEHFFGNVRRLCNRNDCPGNFERSIRLLMLNKALLGNKERVNSRRISDSGAILEPEEPSNCIPDMPIGSYIFEAAVLLRLHPANFEVSVGQRLMAAACPRRQVEACFLLRSMICHAPEPHDCGSTRSSRMTDVAGFTTRKRYIMGSQI